MVWNKGRKWTIKERERISKGLKNSLKFQKVIHSEEYKKKLSESRLGNKNGKFNRGRKFTQEHKQKLREAHLNKVVSEETRQKLRIANLGRVGSESKKIKMRGERNPRWKGGLTKLETKIRNSLEYSKWRLAVFTRDNFACQNCQQVGRQLEAHHIKPFALILRENQIKSVEEVQGCLKLWQIDNGVTLCHECHTQTESYLKNIV